MTANIQQIRDFALCIIFESPRYREFAYAIMDFAGEDRCDCPCRAYEVTLGATESQVKDLEQEVLQSLKKMEFTI